MPVSYAPVDSQQYPPTYSAPEYARGTQTDVRGDARYLTRTPSPTPSEAEVLSPQKKKRRGFLLALLNPETFKDPKELIRLVITVVIIAIVVLFIVYQQKIVEWLRPFADWMRRTPGGWLIPIAILIVMSFPPLFGHEIIAVLCGDVWGIWIGFGIVAAGTLFGELANYFVFRWFCMARGKKWEEKKLQYALLAEVVRQGGFLIAVIIRFSAIPGHFTTAVFASCGMGVFTFLGAATLSLPKQLATVYLGAAQSTDNVSKKTKTIKTIVIIITIVVTIFAMHYVKVQTERIKEEVIYRRRKARQAKLRAAAGLEPDPESAFAHDVADPLLGRPTETVQLDGVRLEVPTPQHAPSHGYAYAPPPGPPPPAPGTWQPDVYRGASPAARG
ncbi:uncharacterized protein TRAVEDRAFT_72912 [Trametes versicolor FP-101664 SS1]|uniref:uncharacterized protein n=1 Tax=Trametes versicolor (strain FP-101664) TaxID=717944 RepID=UPI0004621929|nr:uncharacterized protein TRAVEDRAFT_72912 [Trametes versicolor FP-101664 SS1]EIW58061.1 hypothetical protein TRAVEDRAFT_72912 [Trametes versicolor FP-101664 SS1]